jgi:hypothetical protein
VESAKESVFGRLRSDWLGKGGAWTVTLFDNIGGSLLGNNTDTITVYAVCSP